MQPPLGTQRKGKFEVFVSLLALHERAQLLGGGRMTSLPQEKAACTYTDKLTQTLGLQRPGAAVR